MSSAANSANSATSAAFTMCLRLAISRSWLLVIATTPTSALALLSSFVTCSPEMSMQDVLAALYQDSSAAIDIGFSTVAAFLEAVRWLRPQIALSQPSYISTAPPELPDHVFVFLQRALALTSDELSWLWCRLRDITWAEPSSSSMTLSSSLLDALLEHGLSLQLGESLPRKLCHHYLYSEQHHIISLLPFERVSILCAPGSAFTVTRRCGRKSWQSQWSTKRFFLLKTTVPCLFSRRHCTAAVRILQSSSLSRLTQMQTVILDTTTTTMSMRVPLCDPTTTTPSPTSFRPLNMSSSNVHSWSNCLTAWCSHGQS
jgi:hypothetical protein